MNEIEIFGKSIKDFFTSSMLRIALIPLIVTMILIYTLFFTAADFGISSLQEIAQASQNGGNVLRTNGRARFWLDRPRLADC